MVFFNFACLKGDEFLNFLELEIKEINNHIQICKENIESELDIHQLYFLEGQKCEAVFILNMYNSKNLTRRQTLRR